MSKKEHSQNFRVLCLCFFFRVWTIIEKRGRCETRIHYGPFGFIEKRATESRKSSC